MARLRPVTAVGVLVVSVAAPLTAQPPKEDDRIKQLEKRVADLEKEVNDLRAQLKLPPRPALDNKLIGSWAAKDKDAELAGLRLELDGTCSVSKRSSGKLAVWKGKYEVTGKTVALNKMTSPTFEGQTGYMLAEVVSVDEKELVVRWDGKEVRLERQ